MKTSSKWGAILIVAALMGAAALGCNTVKGAGKDLEEGGKGIQRAAEKVESAETLHTITASAQPGGSITPSGRISVTQGANLSFTIKPGLGYRVADVIVDGKPLGPVTMYKFGNVSADHTISASFAASPGS
jgi:predicted small secreted protein